MRATAATLAAVVAAFAWATATATAVTANEPGRDTDIQFTSPQAAYEQGIAALKSGNYEIAVPAFRAAMAEDSMLPRYFLAQIFADNRQAYADDVAAYRLFEDIVVRYKSRIPPRSKLLSEIYAAALTATAKYKYHGLAAAGLTADPAKAIRMLRHAADFYNNLDAQFELARLQLVGAPGLAKDPRNALYRLSTLAGRKHPGAQARLAEQFYTGRYIDQDKRLALVWISFAQKNAPEHERLWIDDLYQQIYCGSSKSVREDSKGLVAGWRDRGLRSARENRSSELLLTPFAGPDRLCRNGEPVTNVIDALAARDEGNGGALQPTTPALLPPSAPAVAPSPEPAAEPPNPFLDPGQRTEADPIAPSANSGTASVATTSSRASDASGTELVVPAR